MNHILRALNEFIQKVDPDYKRYHKIADAQISKVEDIFLSAVESQRNSLDLPDDIDVRKIPEHINWKPFEDKMEALTEVLINIIVDSGKQAAIDLEDLIIQKRIDNPYSFNLMNPKALDWAVKYVGQQITLITDESKAGVRSIISNSVSEGLSPQQTNVMIRQFIGLTERQSKSLFKYYMELHDEFRHPDQIDRMTNRRSKSLLRDRAEMIARTETISASANGQQLHWNDMKNKGLINDDSLVKEWITTPDDRLCDACRGMNGKQTDIAGNFDFGGKVPPLHPNCRCAIGLVEKPEAEINPAIDDWSEIDRQIEERQNPVQPIKIPKAPYRTPFQKAVQSRIDQGTDSYSDMIEIGQLIRKDFMSASLNKDFQEIKDVKDQVEFWVNKRRIASDEYYAFVQGQADGTISRDLVNSDKKRLLGGAQDHATEQMTKYQKEQIVLETSFTEKQSTAISKSLRKVRPLGMSDITNITGKPTVIKAFKTANKFLPTKWHDRANLLDPVEVVIDQNLEKRNINGQYETFTANDRRISSKISINEATNHSTMLHENVHRINACIPKLEKLEKQFYEYRTKGEDIVTLPGYDIPGKLDKFADVRAYAGRDYYFDGSLELLTVSMQELFYASPDIGLKNILEDEEWADFILGILASI